MAAVTVKPYTSASLYVGDLAPDVTEGLLCETFGRIGQVASIRVCRDSLTRRSLMYAYVNFHSVVDAERALEALNNQYIKGKPCRIMWSQRDPSIRKSGIGNIFIKNLDLTIGHKELYDTFSNFGTILSCKVATDEEGRSKGFGFVHFEGSEAADGAIATVNGKLLKSKQVYVGKFVSKRERLKQEEASWTNVYIKDIDPEITDEELRIKFSQFGEITSAIIMRNDQNVSRGFGFVAFTNHESATRAVNTMNGQILGSKKLTCGRAQKRSERDAILKKSIQQKKSESQGVNLYIKNLEDEIDESRLTKEFSVFGTIRSLKIMKEDNTSKGFGFICYSSPDEAKRAMKEMHNRIIQGFSKPLYVALHETKDLRRAKLAQRQVARKLRVPPNAQPPMSYPPPQSVYYGNGNMPTPGFVYPPQQPMVPMRSRHWPQNAYPVPVPQHQQPGRNPGGRHPGGNVRGPPPGAGARGRGRRPGQNDFQFVLQMSPEEQKNWLGTQLYSQISPLQPERCAKITGMLLDSGWNVEDLFSLLSDSEKLKAKVEEALRVLDQVLISKENT